MNREQAINIGIAALLAIISVASPIWSQPAKQYITSATFSEPVCGVNQPEVLGVFQPFPGCSYGYPMDPVEDATKITGLNLYVNGDWLDYGKYYAMTTLERSAVIIRETTAYQLWRVQIPAEYTQSFPVAYVGVDNFRDLAGNRGRAVLIKTQLDRIAPSVETVTTD